MTLHRRSLALLAGLAMLSLAGCAGAAKPAASSTPYDDAWHTCVTAYQHLPHSLDVLEQQHGGTVTAETPCQNWVSSQGRKAFTQFWTTAEKYVPYVINEGGLEALAKLDG